VPTTIDEQLTLAIRALGPKPADAAPQPDKKAYSEKLSAAIALALAADLRRRGLREARPAGPGELDTSGAERRMAGGIGAKKVDVTWATEESGLLLAISVKTISFRDRATRNYQKNLTNRRADMLMEAVTLHRRFPYSVLSAFFFLDVGAETDNVREGQTGTRRSTFLNAHSRLRLFTGRNDPAGRDEQFERFYIMLVDATAEDTCVRAYEVGKPQVPVSIDRVMGELLMLVGERNPDFYEFDETTQTLIRVRS